MKLAAAPENYAKRPGKDFSRNRKLGFKQLILLFLTMEGECIKEELYTFFGRTTHSPSKAAFYKQLQKLRDGALRSLFLAFNKKLSKKLFNGKYQLIACDGSALDIFRNPNDPDTFYEPNTKSPKGYNQACINACYSILDRRFTDLVIQPGRKHNEYSAFCQMVDAESYRHICREVPMDYLTDARREYRIALRVIRFEIAPALLKTS